MHAPTNSHSIVVKHILRYLKGTTSYGFHITHGSSFALHGFTGADWLVVLMIASLRVATLSFLVRHQVYEWLPYLFWLDINFMKIQQVMHSCSLLY